MTHSELVGEIAKRLNWTDDAVGESLGALIDIISNQLTSGANVSIQDLGVFESEKKSEYILSKIDTDEQVLMPPQIKVSFTPSAHIKEQFLKSLED